MLNKKDYISIDNAKILKKVGYNDPCMAFYCKMNNHQLIYQNECNTILSNINDKFEEEDYAAPTLYEVQQWLLREHNIYIYPDPILSKDKDEICLYFINYYKYINGEWEEINLPYNKYTNYEDALNDGIKYVLQSEHIM